jgi:hypothetical protein
MTEIWFYYHMTSKLSKTSRTEETTIETTTLDRVADLEIPETTKEETHVSSKIASSPVLVVEPQTLDTAEVASLKTSQPSVPTTTTSEYHCLPCPHCEALMMLPIKDLNCKIFRHAIRKSDGANVNPHAPQAECEKWVQAEEIYGCGKPFRFIDAQGDQPARVEICDYI